MPARLYRLLEQEVVPAFYDRDAEGLPRAWLARVRASLRTLAPAFCCGTHAPGLHRADLRADETLDVSRFGAVLDRVRAALSPGVAG